MAAPIRWETKYDRFLYLSAFGEALVYIIIGAIIFATIVYLGIKRIYWTPVLIIYGIGAIGCMLTIGFQGVNIQLKICADYTVRELSTKIRS